MSLATNKCGNVGWSESSLCQKFSSYSNLAVRLDEVQFAFGLANGSKLDLSHTVDCRVDLRACRNTKPRQRHSQQLAKKSTPESRLYDDVPKL